MSERACWWPRLAMLAELALLAAPAASAQDPLVRARLFAAERAYRTAKDSHQVILDAFRAPMPARDSVRAGGLIVESRTPLSGLTRRALQRSTELAWLEVKRALGDSAEVATSAAPLIIGVDSVGTLASPLQAHIWLQRDPVRGTFLRLPLAPGAVAEAMLDRIGALAALRNPPAIREWLSDWLPPRRLAKADWADIAVMLATANSAVTRGCHAGAVSQCLLALGLTPVQDPFTELYSPDDWHVIARTYFRGAAGPWPNARVDCIDHRNSAACLRIIRSRPAPQPIPMDVRRSVAAYALERGGPQAFARLLGARGSALEILETTSGLGADSLIAGWRATVVSATPHAVRPHALEATLMLGWALLFGVVAGRRRP